MSFPILPEWVQGPDDWAPTPQWGQAPGAGLASGRPLEEVWGQVGTAPHCLPAHTEAPSLRPRRLCSPLQEAPLGSTKEEEVLDSKQQPLQGGPQTLH